jgi:hypothetical protein
MLCEHLITIQAGSFVRYQKKVKPPTSKWLSGVFYHGLHPSFQNGSECECNTTFPAPSLKFRTSGSPQYGFKLEFNDDLRPTTYMT